MTPRDRMVRSYAASTGPRGWNKWPDRRKRRWKQRQAQRLSPARKLHPNVWT